MATTRLARRSMRTVTGCDRASARRPCANAARLWSAASRMFWSVAACAVPGRSGKRPQTIPRPCRGSQSRNSDARLVWSRNPEGGRGYQKRLPVRHSDRRGDYRHDPRRVRRRWGGADHRGRIGCRLIKSRLLHRAARPNDEAMYEAWRKAYRDLKKRRNMTDVWYSQQIAK